MRRTLFLCGDSVDPRSKARGTKGLRGERPDHRIFEAAEQGNLEAAARLLKADPKLVEAKNAEGETALHLAAGCRRGEEAALPLVRLLLENGAAPDARNGSNQTPLLYAAYGGFSRVVELLIAKGVAVQYQDANGRSPLHYAAREGRPQVVEILLKHGANPALKDKENRTPLEYAVLRNKPAVVANPDEAGALRHQGAGRFDAAPRGRLLGTRRRGQEPARTGGRRGPSQPERRSRSCSAICGADWPSGPWHRSPRAPTSRPRTPPGERPFTLAVEKGLDQVVSALLDKGADPNAADKNGLTPLDIARDWGSRSAAELLSAKGARPTPRQVHVLKGGAFEIAAAAGRDQGRDGRHPLHRNGRFPDRSRFEDRAGRRAGQQSLGLCQYAGTGAGADEVRPASVRTARPPALLPCPPRPLRTENGSRRSVRPIQRLFWSGTALFQESSGTRERRRSSPSSPGSRPWIPKWANGRP